MGNTTSSSSRQPRANTASSVTISTSSSSSARRLDQKLRTSSLREAIRASDLSEVIDWLNTPTSSPSSFSLIEQEPVTGNTLLHEAVLSENGLILKTILEWLITHNRLLDLLSIQNKQGSTVLHLACQSRHKRSMLNTLIVVLFSDSRKKCLEDPITTFSSSASSSSSVADRQADSKAVALSSFQQDLHKAIFQTVHLQDKTKQIALEHLLGRPMTPTDIDLLENFLHPWFRCCFESISADQSRHVRDLLWRRYTEESHQKASHTLVGDSLRHRLLALILKYDVIQGNQKNVEKLLEDNKSFPLFQQKCAFWAAATGRLEILKELHARGQALDVLDEEGNSLAFFAVANGRLNVMAWVVKEKNQPLTYVNRDGDNAVLRAVRFGQLSMLEWLLEETNQTLNVVDGQGSTPLLLAAANGDQLMAKRLLSEGQSLEVVNDLGYTPLMAALLNGHLSMVKFFLGNQPSQTLTIRNNDGNDLVLTAVENGDLAVLKCLVEECGLSLDVSHNDARRRPLFLAIVRGHLHVLKWLVEEKGQSLSAVVIREELRPLLLAARYGRLDVLKWLMNREKELLNKEKNWASLINAAAQKGWQACVAFILESRLAKFLEKGTPFLRVVEYFGMKMAELRQGCSNPLISNLELFIVNKIAEALVVKIDANNANNASSASSSGQSNKDLIREVVWNLMSYGLAHCLPIMGQVLSQESEFSVANTFYYAVLAHINLHQSVRDEIRYDLANLIYCNGTENSLMAVIEAFEHVYNNNLDSAKELLKVFNRILAGKNLLKQTSCTNKPLNVGDWTPEALTSFRQYYAGRTNDLSFWRNIALDMIKELASTKKALAAAQLEQPGTLTSTSSSSFFSSQSSSSNNGSFSRQVLPDFLRTLPGEEILPLDYKNVSENN